MDEATQKTSKKEAMKLLRELLEKYPHDLTDWESEAFVDMAANYQDNGFLSLVQIKKIKEAHDRVVPKYENLVSSGRVPIGKPVPTPEVLKNLPLRPPRRPRQEEE